MKVKDPLSQSNQEFDIQTVLRRIASQEGNDGASWDIIQTAADYIDQLETNISDLSKRIVK